MKKRILSLLLAVVMLCAMLPQIPMEASAVSYDVININGITGEDIVAQARKYLGVPYDTSGGNYWYRTGFGNTMMFDCSGFVYRVCRDVGLASSRQNYTEIPEGQDAYGNYYITAHTQEQRYYGENISAALNKYITTGDYSDLRPGDLLFLTSDNSSVSHVVIYAGNGKIVHSEGYQGCVAEHPIGRYPTSSNWYFDATRLITCEHNYSSIGVCSKCGVTYNWEYTYDTSCAGIYKVSLSGGIYLRTDKPYAASTSKSALIKEGTQVEVLGSVTNAFDHIWYKVSYNGVVGYTSIDNLTWVRENDKQPLATCDEVVGKDGSVYIRGWAFDPDTPSESVAIHVYIDDVLAGAYTANTSRPDVNNVYGCGNDHGFEFTVPCNTGTHSVVVFAINTTYGEDPKGMGPFSVTVSSHTHSYTSKVTTTATCTTNGVRTYTCNGCSASYTETISATGHSYGSWQTTKEATCTATGTQKRTCSKCGNAETKSISATGSHNYVGKVTANAYCGGTGTKTYTCSGCSASYTETIPATGEHTWGGWGVKQSATCTASGIKTRKCPVCYQEETQTIPATGHSYGSWVTTTAAGCTTTGTQKKTCSSCGDVQTQSITATGHSYTSETIGATCTDYEKIKYTCTKCGNSYTEDISEYSDWSTTKPTGVDASKIETKTQYRYRSISYSTEYSSWSSWSAWQDSSVSETELRDVETQTLYPYYYYYCKKMRRWYKVVCLWR